MQFNSTKAMLECSASLFSVMTRRQILSFLFWRDDTAQHGNHERHLFLESAYICFEIAYICFEFRKGDAYEVEIVDYHSG